MAISLIRSETLLERLSAMMKRRKYQNLNRKLKLLIFPFLKERRLTKPEMLSMTEASSLDVLSMARFQNLSDEKSMSTERSGRILERLSVQRSSFLKTTAIKLGTLHSVTSRTHLSRRMEPSHSRARSWED